jgi:hypothetical protein
MRSQTYRLTHFRSCRLTNLRTCGKHVLPMDIFCLGDSDGAAPESGTPELQLTSFGSYRVCNYQSFDLRAPLRWGRGWGPARLVGLTRSASAGSRFYRPPTGVIVIAWRRVFRHELLDRRRGSGNHVPRGGPVSNVASEKVRSPVCGGRFICGGGVDFICTVATGGFGRLDGGSAERDPGGSVFGCGSLVHWCGHFGPH